MKTVEERVEILEEKVLILEKRTKASNSENAYKNDSKKEIEVTENG